MLEKVKILTFENCMNDQRIVANDNYLQMDFGQ